MSTLRNISFLLILTAMPSLASAKDVAYIYGDVASDGTIPSGAAAPFHQMLLTDTGNLLIDNLDLVASAPGKWVAYDRVFEVTVNDGNLNLGFTASANNTLLYALVVISQ